MNAVGVVVALESEARALGPAARRRDGLSVLSDGTLLLVGGMGADLAAQAARRLVDAGAKSLMSVGFAGGLDPALGAGCVVLPGEVVSGDGSRFPAAEAWRDQLHRAIGARQMIAAGKLLTAAATIDSVAAKANAFRETGAVAVDMESFSVAAVAAAHSLPFTALRVIVDTALDVLPRSVVAASRGGHFSARRLLSGLAAAPLEVFPLIHLAGRYRAATRSLTGVARAGLASTNIADALAA